MNESWRVVLQGDALAALTKYREKQAKPEGWCDCEACEFFRGLNLVVHPWKAHEYWEAKQQGFKDQQD